MTDPRRRIGHYLAAATKGLWGRERAVVKEELEAHIEARVAAHLLAGMSEEAAVEATLAELGASKSVGSDMARVYAPQVVMGAAARGAWRQLWTRVVESLLIVVAIALGVGVIVAVASFLDIGRQIAGLMSLPLQSRAVSIQATEAGRAFEEPDAIRAVRLGQARTRPPVFSLSDLDEVRDAVPSADHVYVRESAFVFNVDESSRQDYVNVATVSEGFLDASRVTLLEGSLITASDIVEERPVVVLRREALAALQITGDPIGQSVAMWNMQPGHTIIGIVDTDSLDQHTYGFAPYRPGSGSFRFIYLAVDDPRDLQAVREQVADYIGVKWGERVNVTAQPSLSRYSREQRATAFAIAGFASVGLLVASLNVMNLMLARVLRRQSFIGVRRSLGATRSDVRKELIFEGSLLGLVGGAIGVLVGTGLLSAYNASIEATSTGLARGVGFSWTATGIGLLLALIASLVFTLYPAGVASRNTIVSALREG